jgi:hypothetical protein
MAVTPSANSSYELRGVSACDHMSPSDIRPDTLGLPSPFAGIDPSRRSGNRTYCLVRGSGDPRARRGTPSHLDNAPFSFSILGTLLPNSADQVRRYVFAQRRKCGNNSFRLHNTQPGCNNYWVIAKQAGLRCASITPSLAKTYG